MKDRHLFLIDPIAQLNFDLDTSLHIAYEMTHREQKVFIATSRDLFWDSLSQTPQVRAQGISFQGQTPKSLRLEGEETASLDSFRTIQMRKEPPFNMDYIATTWLLDRAGPKTKVVNAPGALRTFNEKLATLRFPDDCHRGLYSADYRTLYAYLENQCAGDGILKPLDLFGGRGIERIESKLSSKDSILDQLKRITKDGTEPHLMQPFDSRVFEGEVRVCSLNGKPLIWCLKKPKGGEFLANTRSGATLHPYEPSPELFARIERVAGALVREGIFFVGFDVIGEKISEINITSPRILQAPSEASRLPYQTYAQWAST